MSFKQISYNFEPEQQQYFFEPQEDISAYELAQLLPVLRAAWRDLDVYQVMNSRPIPSWMKAKIDGLPENLRRHFK